MLFKGRKFNSLSLSMSMLNLGTPITKSLKELVSIYMEEQSSFQIGKDYLLWPNHIRQ